MQHKHKVAAAAAAVREGEQGGGAGGDQVAPKAHYRFPRAVFGIHSLLSDDTECAHLELTDGGGRRGRGRERDGDNVRAMLEAD